MREWTDLQLLAVSMWLKLDMNVPSRADHYVMELDKDVRGLFDKNAKPRKLEFRDEEASKTPMIPGFKGVTKEMIERVNRSKHIAALRKRQKPPPVKRQKRGD